MKKAKKVTAKQIEAEQQKEDARLEKLIRDLVDLALTNNQVISKGSFHIDNLEALEFAIKMNNEVLRTYTDIKVDE